MVRISNYGILYRAKHYIMAGEEESTMKEQYLFSFLDIQQLTQLGEEIEDVLYTDPHAVLTKARVFSEWIVKEVYQREKINEVFEVTHAERLHKLLREGITTDDIHEKLEWIRKIGNKAAHEPQFGQVEHALQAHRYLYDIAVWYMELYGDVDFTPPTYRIPKARPSAAIDATKLGEIIQQTIQQTLGTSIEEKLRELQEELKDLKNNPSNEDSVQQTETEKKPQSSFRLIEYLRNQGLEVLDKRPNGGTIWVVGGWELNEILFPLKEKKIYFRFTKNGSRSTKRRPAWFLLGKYEGE
jgi:Domain of unknown function (DUF4145)